MGDRTELRASWGASPGDFVLLSVGSEFKFDDAGPFSFEPLARGLLAAVPNLRLVLVGPRPAARWSAIAGEFGGRLTVLGPRPNVQGLLHAADGYLDSFPVNSITASLEAMLSSLPVISHCPAGLSGSVFVSGGPAFDAVDCRADAIDDIVARVGYWAANPSEAPKLGERARNAALSYHAPEGWLSHLKTLYASLSVLDPWVQQDWSEVETGAEDELHVLLFEAYEKLYSWTKLTSEIAGWLSLPERARIARSLPFRDAVRPHRWLSGRATHLSRAIRRELKAAFASSVRIVAGR